MPLNNSFNNEEKSLKKFVNGKIKRIKTLDKEKLVRVFSITNSSFIRISLKILDSL